MALPLAAKPVARFAKEHDMTPEEKQIRQEIADRKMREAATKAYDAADKTPPAPAVKKAKGGSVTRADGCITKAHTKGKMITMAGGGMC
jgi:hypothetical protein